GGHPVAGDADSDGERPDDVVPVAELAVVVVAPTEDGAVAGGGAGERGARRDPGPAAEAAHRDRLRDAAHRSVAELAGAVLSPAVHLAAHPDHAGVLRAGVDGDRIVH